MDKPQAIKYKKERKFWIPETDVEKRVYEVMKRRKYREYKDGKMINKLNATCYVP